MGIKKNSRKLPKNSHSQQDSVLPILQDIEKKEPPKNRKRNKTPQGSWENIFTERMPEAF
jgi:hypothetical protein